MLKKIFFTTMILLSITMFSVAYAAENIVIEGENPADGNRYNIVTSDTASEGKYISVQYSALNKEGFWISYDVTTEEAGYYDLFLESTRPSYEHCSDFRVSVNGGTELAASRDAKEFAPTYIQGNHMGRLDFGGVYLQKGKNTIKFTIDEKVPSTYNGILVCFYLDRIEFVPAECYVRKIEPGKPNGIFEEKDGVSFEIVMNAPPAEAVEINYTAKDYAGAVKKQGSFSVPTSSKAYKLSLDLDIGWYNVTFSYGSESVSKNIAVVHNYSDRAVTKESPFALDIASNWEAPSYLDKLDYARAARLLGVGWIRERFDWAHIYKTEDGYGFYPWNDDSINVMSEEGLNILEVFHSNPSEYAQSGKDLRVIYDVTKSAAKYYEGKVQAWEVWNEPDIGFGKDSAEEYSSYFKAAAIGIDDSGSNVLKLNAGMAEYPIVSGANCSFSKLCLRNGIMNYSDAYTYHIYSHSDTSNSYSRLNNTADNHLAAHKSYANDKPIWVSEGGYGVYSENDELSQAEQMTQARALIRTMSDSVAKGNDMHFWFILGSRQEGTQRHFGMLNLQNEPCIAYSAYSNLTYQLGGSEYKGEMVTSTADITGKLFTDGEKDIAVMWSRSDGMHHTIYNAEYVTVVDMVGNESVVKGINGICTVTLSQNPVYIIFDSECSARNYYKQSRERKETISNTIKDSDKIVLRQTSEKASAKENGYEIDDANTEIVLEVYNFSDKDKSGTISAKTEGRFVVTPAQTEVTVAAGGMETISFTVTAAETGDSHNGYLIYSGVFDGEAVTPSISKLHTAEENIVWEDSVAFSGWKAAEAWDVTNIARGGSATAELTDNGVKFDVKFSGGDQWCYPRYTLSDSDKENIKNMTGIAFDFTSDIESGTINAGLAGWLMTPITIEAGTTRVMIPFSGFSGNISESALTTLALGINSSQSECSYTIENLCLYDDGTQVSEAKVIISGIGAGEIYEQGDVTASLEFPQDAARTIVLLNGEEISHSGDTVEIQNLKSGRYELSAIAKMPEGEALDDTITFYVQRAEEETEYLFRREAEDFDRGNASQKAGNAYSGGNAAEVVSSKSSEELLYHICVPTNGRYRLGCKVSAGDEYSTFTLFVNGNAAEMQANDSLLYADVELNAGENDISFHIQNVDDTGCNFIADYIEVERFLYDEIPYITLEGEDYVEGANVMKLTQSWNASTLDFSNLSQANGLKLEGGSEASPYAKYSINAPKAGNYKMNFVSTPLNDTWSYCRLTMVVGDTEYSLTSSNSARADDSEFECDAKFYNYSYNDVVYLEQGINSVTIKPTSSRLKGDYYLLLDKVEFIFDRNALNEVWTSRNYLGDGQSAQIYVRKKDTSSEAAFESSDKNIAEVDLLGKVYGKKAGRTVISVTIDEDVFEIPVIVYDSESGVAPLEFYGGKFKVGGFESSTLDIRTALYKTKENELIETNHYENAEVSKGKIFAADIKAPTAGTTAKGFLWSSEDEMRPLFPATESKAYAKLEGEAYIEGTNVMKLSQSWNASTLDFSRLSELNGLKLEGGSSVSPYAIYEINVPEAGGYRMDFVCTPIDDTLNYCNVNVEINETSYSLTAANATRRDESEINCDAVMYNYSYNSSVYLEEGVNTITISPIKARDWDSTYYFLLDVIEFTKK